jgi:hypothetical protein
LTLKNRVFLRVFLVICDIFASKNTEFLKRIFSFFGPFFAPFLGPFSHHLVCPLLVIVARYGNAASYACCAVCVCAWIQMIPSVGSAG